MLSLHVRDECSGRIGAEEVINDTDGKEAEELDELLKEEAAKTQAILLEMEGDCEKAFFKMDNVLIDDRLVHVDFSQSVSKMKWKGKVLLNGPKSSKYDLLLEEEGTSHWHAEKKHKDKKHNHSDNKDTRKSKKSKWDREETRREKKTDWQHSHSRERDDGDDHHKHSMSHEKHRPEGLDKGHRESSRNHSPKKSKDNERNRHR